jgi:hypothetical protein
MPFLSPGIDTLPVIEGSAGIQLTEENFDHVLSDRPRPINL